MNNDKINITISCYGKKMSISVSDESDIYEFEKILQMLALFVGYGKNTIDEILPGVPE